jgi:uncharacterized SAM-binding protein YcdF (DUF218 family)
MEGLFVRRAVVVTVLLSSLLVYTVFVAGSHVEWILWKFLGVGSGDTVTCPQEAVVVLGGGYYFPRDRLNGESILRVLKGVQVFKACNARWLVMSGRSDLGRKERHAELMRDLAVGAGVPQERILLETDSKNTWEHPVFLQSKTQLGAQSRLAVVTSPWHLRRTLMEFRRHFPRTVPVASYLFRPEMADMLVLWLPQLKPLDADTMFHEYAGIVWYGMRHCYSMLSL